MAATACAERWLRLGGSPPGRPRQQLLWRVAFGVSLLLHGALLWLPVGGLRDPTALLPPLVLTFKSPAIRTSASVAAPSPRPLATVARRGDPSRARSLPRAAPAAPVAQLEPVTTQAAAQRGVTMDELRAQARDLAHAPAEQLVRRGDRHDPLVPAVATDPLDAPRLEALARRIGKPLRVASEQRLADGSRMVRFVGNVCLHIPLHLPLGFENSFGPTVLLPTNCRD